jgi:hypothetical protein
MAMVKYESKMDQTSKIYISKAARQTGITSVLQIAPNSSAYVIFKKGTPLKHVLESIRSMSQRWMELKSSRRESETSTKH